MKWNSTTRLGLGTAEFGMPYGRFNTLGKPQETEVARILDRAAEAGFSLLDTAPAYGASEDVLGRCLPPASLFRVVTKTAPFKDLSSDTAVADVLRVFNQSLQKLKRERVYGLLVHHAEDLLSDKGRRLWEALEGFKQKGQVAKIGVSVYGPEQIEHLLSNYSPDLIQVPINVLDQRLTGPTGLLSQLKKRGIEVHGRSIFLQGVLLTAIDQLPPFWAKAKTLLEEYHGFLLTHELTPVQAAIGFALQQEELDTLLIGVNSLEELNQIVDGVQRMPEKRLDWTPFACSQEDLLDPRRWPSVSGGRS